MPAGGGPTPSNATENFLFRESIQHLERPIKLS